jgi:hypothetical protein
MSLQRSSQKRFRPHIEFLEDRVVPTVSALVDNNGTSLILTGDPNQNHQVSIMDRNGSVTVTADGKTANFSGITSIDYESGNQRDNVNLVIMGDAANTITGVTVVQVRMKQGNDTFNGALLGNIGKADGSVTGFVAVEAQGGTGSDTVSMRSLGTNNVNAGSKLSFFGLTGTGAHTQDIVQMNGNILGVEDIEVDNPGTSPRDKDLVNLSVNGNVGATGSLTMDINAPTSTPGNGTLNGTISYTGQLKGQLDALIAGGKGNNTLNTNLFFTAGSNGTWSANEKGGAGNDTLIAEAHKQVATDPVKVVNSVADGGGGFNKATLTPNFMAQNDQVVIPA